MSIVVSSIASRLPAMNQTRGLAALFRRACARSLGSHEPAMRYLVAKPHQDRDVAMRLEALAPEFEGRASQIEAEDSAPNRQQLKS